MNRRGNQNWAITLAIIQLEATSEQMHVPRVVAMLQYVLKYRDRVTCNSIGTSTEKITVVRTLLSKLCSACVNRVIRNFPNLVS